MLQKLTRKETPFSHLTDTFRWGATWGFFPGDCPKTTDFRTFAFSKWNCLKNIIFITSAIVPAMLVYVLIGSKGLTLWEMYNFLKGEVGFYTIDIISSNLFQLAWIFNAYIAIFTFKISIAGLNQFVTDYDNLEGGCPVSSITNKRITEKNKMVIRMFHGLHFFQNIFTTSYMILCIIKVIEEKGLTDLSKDVTFLTMLIVECILIVVCNHLMIFPVLVGFLDGITYQSCGFMTEAFNTWSQVLENELQNMGIKTIEADVSVSRVTNVVFPMEKTSFGHLEIEKHLDFGYQLTVLTESCDNALKYINIGNFVALVVYLILSLFTASSLVFNLYNSNVCMVTFSLSFGILSCLLMLRLYFLCSCGQYLVDARVRAARHLEDYISNNTKLDEDVLFETISIKTRFLLEKLRMNDLLKPLGYFVINKANFFTAEATIITYTVVLLQFKVTDVYGNNGSSNFTGCGMNSTNLTSF